MQSAFSLFVSQSERRQHRAFRRGTTFFARGPNHFDPPRTFLAEARATSISTKFELRLAKIRYSVSARSSPSAGRNDVDEPTPYTSIATTDLPPRLDSRRQSRAHQSRRVVWRWRVFSQAAKSTSWIQAKRSPPVNGKSTASLGKSNGVNDRGA